MPQGTISYSFYIYHRGKKVFLSYGLPLGASPQAHRDARRYVIERYYESLSDSNTNKSTNYGYR